MKLLILITCLGINIGVLFLYSLWKHMSWSLDAAHRLNSCLLQTFFVINYFLSIKSYSCFTTFSVTITSMTISIFFLSFVSFSFIPFSSHALGLILTNYNYLQKSYCVLYLLIKYIFCFIFFVKHKAFLSWGYVWTIFQIMKSTIWKNYMIYIETINCRSNDTV